MNIPPVTSERTSPPTRVFTHAILSRWADGWLALATFLFAACFYGYHMAPEVTLEYSGELVTATYTFGVPHPPGYPLWCLLGFFWSHLIVPFGNPAWRIALLSVFTGALLVGLLTLVMIRSSRLLLQALPWAHAIAEERQRWITMAVGVSTALLFGANHGVWYWACIPEQGIQNVFCFLGTGFLFFWWLLQPQRMGRLYLTLLFFGAGFVTHYTSLGMGAALLVGVLAAGLARHLQEPCADISATHDHRIRFPATFLEVVIAALFTTGAILMFLTVLSGNRYEPLTQRPESPVLIAGVVMLITGCMCRWLRLSRALLCTGALLAGCAIYLYVPIAAATNPPMNWGYAATREGFLHVIHRGQFERICLADVFSPAFATSLKMFAAGLVHEYSWGLCLLAWLTLPALALWPCRFLCRHSRQRLRNVFATPALPWLTFVWAAFLVASLGILIVVNPTPERQEQLIVSKFFAPAHGFCAMLIGYGLTVLISLALRWWQRLPDMMARIGCLAILCLPLVPYFANREDCALETDDYGYEFGYRIFHPGGGYPNMANNAVLFGGTDAGRFVSTYMIFCESRVRPEARFRDPTFDRSDVYIITQNALADHTYLCYIRDQYDVNRPTNNVTRLQRALGRNQVYPSEPIPLPTEEDSTRAFQQFIEEWKAGKAPPGSDVQMSGGRVQVYGVQSVMAINGILAKWIFDRNKAKHPFYVEESYVIQWMYEYMRPAGIIFKLENEPLPSPIENRALWDEIIAKDKAYWDKLTAEFMARRDFDHNLPARRTFSKLRSAIAGLYAWRGLIPEAEYAFRQSLQLYPDSPEACFRLADLLMSQRQYDETRQRMVEYLQSHPYNKNVRSFIEKIDTLKKCDRRRLELQKKAETGATVDDVLELASIYARMNMPVELTHLSTNILNNTNFPTTGLIKLGKLFLESRRTDQAQETFRCYTTRAPQDAEGWVELGWTQLLLGQTNEALASWCQAVEVGGEATRAVLRTDQRFQAIWQQPELPAQFRALIEDPRVH